MTYEIGDFVEDRHTGSKFVVLSEIRPFMRLECLLYGTREIFSKPIGSLKKMEKSEARDVNKTLAERGSRYGKFHDVSGTIQDLKQVMYTSANWDKLTPSQREALEMIQHKIGRMLNGDHTYLDNAVDIVGYATLMLKNMQGDTEI